MQRHSIVIRAAALAAILAGLGRAPLLGQTAPPWKPFVPSAVTGLDGQPVPAILAPGPTPNTWVVIVGGSRVWQMTALESPIPNPPPPTPPAPPTPAEQIKTLAFAAAEKLPAAGRQEDARKLAAVYRALADQIPGSIDSIDKLITANRYAREIALGPQRSLVWEPWVKEIGRWLDAQRAGGTIRSAEDCKPVWRAIADALETVK
mgnify:CR=1 FL=1